jgi:leucyl/phenylalanyl-tRNA---protein transferase
MKSSVLPIPWLEPGQDFPPLTKACQPNQEYPGLLAAGGSLDSKTLIHAYSQGIFPWFSEGQPILWWSPDPRMVLRVSDFKLKRSLRKTISKFRIQPDKEIRFDTAFEQVIQACSQSFRRGQSSTWIVKDMIHAYCDLHRRGLAHSVETWINGQLAGGLYCVCIGHAVFGESMFTLATDASKIALSALIGFCRHHGIEMIDCQQNTAHLASFGAQEIERFSFVSHIQKASTRDSILWKFDPIYWNNVHSELTSK